MSLFTKEYRKVFVCTMKVSSFYNNAIKKVTWVGCDMRFSKRWLNCHFWLNYYIPLSTPKFCHELCLHHQPISCSKFQFYLKLLQVTTSVWFYFTYNSGLINLTPRMVLENVAIRRILHDLNSYGVPVVLKISTNAPSAVVIMWNHFI